MWHHQMYQHTHTVSPSRLGEKEKNIKSIYIIMAQNYLNLIRKINLYIQKLQQIPSRINSKRSTADTSWWHFRKTWTENLRGPSRESTCQIWDSH